MVRTLRFETERYGHYSLAGESVYDRPHQWGSKRTGPDLARVGGRYSDDWHRVHLIDPRAVVPESNMPGFPWLQDNRLDGRQVAAHMTALQRLGDPGIELVGDGRQLEQRLLECVEAVLVAWCHVDPSVSWRVTCAWHAA